MSKRILIVDDVKDIAEAFRKQLDLAGPYQVDVVGGGRQALEMMAVVKYDLVLLDLVMPEVDGIEVLKAVQADPEKYGNAPIIVSSNVTAKETQEEVMSLGAAAVVVKTDVDMDGVVGGFFKGR